MNNLKSKTPITDQNTRIVLGGVGGDWKVVPASVAEDLELQLNAALEKLNFQNIPNRREPTRGGYEFYINEEWSCIRDTALNEDVGCVATLMKTRYDPDDERVRVRRILDDDAILNELDMVKMEKNILKYALDNAIELASKGDEHWEESDYSKLQDLLILQKKYDD